MSKEIFEKNLKAMEKWYQGFADAIRNQEYEKDELTIESETSWDGETIFRVTKEGRKLYLNGKRDAKDSLETWMQRLGEVHKYAPVILLGMGSGLYLKKLIENTDETVNVILYEPSVSIFLKTIEEVDLSKEIESRPIAFIIEGMNEKGFDNVIGKLISIETVEFLKQRIHPNYRELFPEKILEIMKKIEKRTSSIFITQNTGVKFSTHSARNQLQNLKYLVEGYNTKRLCEAIPHDVPAILVAAGPSLNKNIQDLKKAKNRAFILAVDTAVKPLLNAGIIPDAFITIDAKKPLKLVEVDAIRDVPVIAPILANTEILEQQRGKKIFYFDGTMLPKLIYMMAGKVLYDVNTGGSVACSGFSLLYKMGFSTIILVGQDLAYTDNKSHADGTFAEKMPEEDTKKMVRVKGNYEDEVPTKQSLKVFLDWFNMYVKGCKEHRDVRVINATAGGAYIENTELMTLQEALDETCSREVNFKECIENMASEFTEEERKKVVDYVKEIPKSLEEIKKEAKSLYTVYHKIEKICKSGHIDKDAYLKQLKRVKKLSKKCEGQMAYELVAVTMVAADYVVKSESLYQRDSMEEEGKAIAKQGMRYSKMLQQCTQLLLEFAEDVLSEIE